MAFYPSYNGLTRPKTVLRESPKPEEKKEETKVTTQRPAPSTPSPRGHA